MGLKVFEGKNQASRSYENEFFRAFASTLAAIFDQKGYEGVLLGHPRSLDNKYFQPDCLLITRNSILIIDFKKFDNMMVHLPSEEAFKTAEWSAEERGARPRFVTVKGGSSVNPFMQLQKQAGWLKDILLQRGIDVSILTRVLFDGDVQIEGTVPGRFQSFFAIANKYDYPNILIDGVNIIAKSRYADFDLSVKTIESLVQRFEVSEYRKFMPLNVEDLEKATSLAQSSQAKQAAAALLADLALKEVRLNVRVRKAEALGKGLVEERRRLEDAQRATEVARENSERLSRDFDEKRHTLEVAKEHRRSKEAEADSDKYKSKRALVAMVSLLVVSVMAVAGIILFFSLQQQSSTKLVEQQKAGIECISVSEVANFVGDMNVCVVYRVGFVRDAGDFVFLQDKSYGSFTSWIVSKSIMSEEDAITDFQGKTVEVRGDINDYEGTPQIKVVDRSQITVIE
jgi:hypothetical protein